MPTVRRIGMMLKKTVARIIALFLAAFGIAGCANSPDTWKPRVRNETELSNAIEKAIKGTGQPSAACALIRSTEDPIVAAAGRTRIDGGEEVTTKSLYHIGSTMKMLTATLTAILIEENILSYETTLADAFPDIPMHPDYRKVTILDLIYSRGGIIPFQNTDNEEPEIVEEFWLSIPARSPGSPETQREMITRYALARTPIQGEGNKAVPVYSNVGWAILGHILERTAGIPFEGLFKERILEPLGIKGYKFSGWPDDAYGTGEPIGHYPPETVGAKHRAQSAADNYRFPDWMNPAGGLSLDIHGFAAVIREQLLGLKGEGTLLNRSAYELIHSVGIEVDISTMYQLDEGSGKLKLGHGVAVEETELGKLSAGEGSGGTYLAFMVIYPGLDIAFAGLTNAGDGMEVLSRIIKETTGFSFE